MELGVGARELFCAKKLSLPEGSDSSLPAYKSEKGEELCMKKRFLAAALALAMLLMMVPSAFAASDGFDDVPGHWAEDAINRWSGYGVVNGVGDNQFAPNGTLTRAQAAQVFANLLDLEVQADISRYTDVPEGSWYHNAIAQCVAAGILTGTGGSTMDPQSPVTREELFVMFARALNIRPQSSSDVTFGDSGEVSGWAQGYINALADRGFVSGVGGGMLAPGEAINRASVMSLLDKTISDYANTSGTTVGNASGVVLVVADNVSVAGDVDTLVVYGGSASVTGSQVAEATVAGENASLSVSGSAVVERVDVAGAEAVLTLTGSVRAGQVTVSGESAQVSLSGQAQAASVAVEETAAGAGLTVGAGSAVTTVDSAAENVTISGSGTVETANVSGNNTTVNTDGTDLTVAQGTTGVTENDKPVSGGTTVETQPEQPVTPPVHIHSYIATEIKASDADITVGVQYTCYAGDDSYIEWNGNAVARVGDSYYVELPNAFGQAANDTVILLKNSTLTETIVITENVTFDMDGHTLIFDYAGLLDLYEDGALTVEGNGTMLMEENTSSVLGYLIRMDDDSRLVIQDGQYFTGLTCVQAGGNSVAEIYNGTFDAFASYSGNYWHLNLIDNSNAEIVVYGGTFKNYNPAESHTENPVANFVADRYTVTEEESGEDIWYTVVPLTAENAAAEVNGVYYENLTDAIAAADGQTVTVLEDTAITNTPFTTAITGKTITLEMADNDITLTVNQDKLTQTGVDKNNNPLYNVSVNVTSNQDGTRTSLTIRNGKLQLNNATYTTANFAVETGCSLTLENVDVNATGSVLFPSGDAASVTVKNSTITTTGVYGIGTNAADTNNYSVVITVENSTINMEASDGDSCGLIINVAGTMNVSDTTVNGQRQAVIVRAGTASFTNCTLNSKPVKLSWVTGSMYTGSWGSGDEVPYGALIVGNQTSNSYLADAIVTLENCDLSVAAVTEDDTFKVFAIYAIRLNNGSYKTEITATGVNNITGTVLNYNNTATISGVSESDIGTEADAELITETATVAE